MTALLFKDPITFLILAIALLYSVIIHEVSHGWIAYLFGDTTAKDAGRLSLNPAIHLDPIGTLMLFLVGFGWAKPVPINYSGIKNFRIGLICVSLAGCAANILIATISMLLIQLPQMNSNPMIATILIILIKVNIILGAFNLIPIPPLDGSRILLALLPQRAQIELMKLEPFGFIIILALLFTGMLNPAIIFVQNIILLIIKFILRIP